MNRRSALKGLFGFSAASSVPVAQSVTAESDWPTADRPNTYNGHLMFWTGWSGSHDSLVLFGQWIACRTINGLADDSVYLAVSVPGMIGGAYRQGSVFNLTCRKLFVTLSTPQSVKDGAVRDGLACMKRLIDETAGVNLGRLGASYMLDEDECHFLRQDVERAKNPQPAYQFGFSGFRQA